MESVQVHDDAVLLYSFVTNEAAWQSLLDGLRVLCGLVLQREQNALSGMRRVRLISTSDPLPEHGPHVQQTMMQQLK